MASNRSDDAPRGASLGSLRLIWRMALNYPGRLVGAALSS